MAVDVSKLPLEDQLYLSLPWHGSRPPFADSTSYDPPGTSDKKIDKLTSAFVENYPTEMSLIAARDLNNYLDAYWQGEPYDRPEPRGFHDPGNILTYNGEPIVGPRGPISNNRDYVYNKMLDNLVLNQNRKGKQLSDNPFLKQNAEYARNPEIIRNLPVKEKTYSSNPNTSTTADGGFKKAAKNVTKHYGH